MKEQMDIVDEGMDEESKFFKKYAEAIVKIRSDPQHWVQRKIETVKIIDRHERHTAKISLFLDYMSACDAGQIPRGVIDI